MRKRFPRAINSKKVGTYPAMVKAGGGCVWDAVLEYRVWCCPKAGAPDEADGSDYFLPFSNYPDALRFSHQHKGAEAPLALVLQHEYINEPVPGQYEHVRKRRITEWQVDWLSRPKRDKRTIRDFFSPFAPPNRLDILRGLAPKPRPKRR
jgi:hypothetical protein